MNDNRSQISTFPTMVDVAIVGAGPAGRYLATCLVDRGLRLALIDPDLQRVWPNNYGLWDDEVADLPISIPFAHTFAAPAIFFEDTPKNLSRTYGFIDNQALFAKLEQELNTDQVIRRQGRVIAADEGAARTVLILDDDTEIRARQVIDASGGAAQLLRRPTTPTPGFQRAYGRLIRCTGDPLDGQSMVLMDYRPIPGGRDVGAPTFSYGMHLGDDRYFVEETVLVSDDKTAFKALKTRQDQRLAMLGVQIVATEDEEFCHIPMGGALPDLKQSIVGFGATAGLVHPATGYQMARMLRAGPPLADAIVDGFQAGSKADELGPHLWQTLWPRHLRQARQLLLFGQTVLRSLDREKTARFFDTFFSLDAPDWQDFLSGDVDARRLASIMWRFFTAADTGLRLGLTFQALSSSPQVLDAFRPRSLAGGDHG